MKGPESYEKDKICKYLDTLRCWYFRPYMAGFGKAGVADIIACIDGRFISIEVKRPGKGPTPRQQTRMDEIDKVGGLVVAGDAEHVIAHLKYVFDES